ncbi:MAG: glycerol-3-phosphate acyltransferase, partial [Isosphaeraceae bacterium]
VGSGNIGATNVGRVLGFRYFWVVFLFDLAKGLVPTWAFPHAVAALTGSAVSPDLPVLTALAAILGHNYPVYLGFKGGKGVATSLGAMLALDPIASLTAAATFVLCLVICRYVSLSSLLGAGAFALAHFVRTPDPLARGNLAMTIVTAALVTMMIVRHRKNLARIRLGTEPKVPLRRSKSREGDSPSPPTPPHAPPGKIAVGWLLVLAIGSSLIAGGLMVAASMSRSKTLTVGRYVLREVDRAATGHQRAERLVFAADGQVLAVTCPRYQRLVLYRLTAGDHLDLLNDLELDGQPVAIATHGEKLLVLQRPPGDHRHIEPGWVQVFDLSGRPIGERSRVGFYPDDLAVTGDGRHLVVLTSGRAGETAKPVPAASLYAIEPETQRLAPSGRSRSTAKTMTRRITMSASGRAAVTLLGSNTVAAIDLADPAQPRLIGRSPLPTSGPALSLSYPRRLDRDARGGGSESVLVPSPGWASASCRPFRGARRSELSQSASRPCWAAWPLRSGSGWPLTEPSDRSRLLGGTRPYAVANRSGGVHLVSIRPAIDPTSARPPTEPLLPASIRIRFRMDGPGSFLSSRRRSGVVALFACF